MADYKPVIPNTEGEENVVAAKQHTVRTLGKSGNLTEGLRKILEHLGDQLSTMALTADTKGREFGDFEKRLRSIQEKVMNLEADQSMKWGFGSEAICEYLEASDEAQRLGESLRRARLEVEFSHILIQNKQSFDPEHMSFRSSEADIPHEDSICSDEDGLAEESLRTDSSSKGAEEFIIDLVHPDVIPDLNRIVNVMFTSHFDQECCQAYINIRKAALDDYLFIIPEVEKMSIEEVLKMDWGVLTIKIKKWIRAMKFFIRFYLASEKRLCDQIFGKFELVKPNCFVEISKAPVFLLLNFGDAIAIGPRQPENLFCILNMYEVLADLLPDIDALFFEEAGSSVRFECRKVLKRLGDFARGIVLEFESAVGSNTSTDPLVGGGIHHLSKYVMNYIKALTGYIGTLNVLLGGSDGDDPVSLSPDMLPVDGEGNEDGNSATSATPIALQLKSLTSVLESNLDIKSKQYKDAALQHFFLMNNIYYMIQKVKGPELKPLFGVDWIRQHNGKFQQYAMNYERATWTSVLNLLKDEGMCTPGSHSVSKTVVKKRFKSFNIAFEEVYRFQRSWLIPDLQLREDLRISVSLKVIQAYRTFVGRHGSLLKNSRNIKKYMKYTADDLQKFILDLFEGSPRKLPNSLSRPEIAEEELLNEEIDNLKKVLEIDEEEEKKSLKNAEYHSMIPVMNLDIFSGIEAATSAKPKKEEVCFELAQHHLVNRRMEDGSNNEAGQHDGGHHAPSKLKDANHLVDSLKVKLESAFQSQSKNMDGASTYFLGIECCIYRVEEKFHQLSHHAYIPDLVSIGPFHRGKGNLPAMQQYKLLYLRNLLTRATTTTTITEWSSLLKECVESVMSIEEKARKCYSEPINLSSKEFIEMMVVDGLFIIELFLRNAGAVGIDKDDPLFDNTFNLLTLVHDLVLLENQLPLLVLDSLFNIPKLCGEIQYSSITKLALNFFHPLMLKDTEVLEKYSNYEGKHLLDLLGKTFLPLPSRVQTTNNSWKSIPSAVELKRAGIKFKKGSTEGSFLDIKFSNDGVLEIPFVIIEDQNATLLRNLLAFEQWSGGSETYITSYVILMKSIINSPGDVGLLRSLGIITNCSCDDEDILNIFIELSSGVNTIGNFYYASLCDQVNTHYKNTLRCDSLLMTFGYAYHFIINYSCGNNLNVHKEDFFIGGLILLICYLAFLESARGSQSF